MNSPLQLPPYAKFGLISLGFISILAFLYVSGSILIPITCATLLAIILDRLVHILVHYKFNRLWAIIVTLTFAVLVVAFISIFVISQVTNFTDSFPALIDKFQNLLNSIISMTSDHLNVSSKDVSTWVAKEKQDLMSHSSTFIGQTIGTLGGILIVIFLTPVYIFMILYYKSHLVEFIHKLFKKNDPDAVDEIFGEIKIMIQNYLLGLIRQAAIIASLYSVGFFIIGIDYAILLGIIGALLNVVPFIGAWSAAALFVTITLVTKSTFSYAIIVFLFFLVVHFIDNTFIIPKIVASRVRINALTALIAVFAGHAVWGVPGMFLSIPLVAIMKLIFDRIEPLKPWGFLFGDPIPVKVKGKLKINNGKR